MPIDFKEDFEKPLEKTLSFLEGQKKKLVGAHEEATRKAEESHLQEVKALMKTLEASVRLNARLGDELSQAEKTIGSLRAKIFELWEASQETE